MVMERVRDVGAGAVVPSPPISLLVATLGKMAVNHTVRSQHARALARARAHTHTHTRTHLRAVCVGLILVRTGHEAPAAAETW